MNRKIVKMTVFFFFFYKDDENDKSYKGRLLVRIEALILKMTCELNFNSWAKGGW